MNLLKQYKDNNPDMTWADIAEKTGISESHLYVIARMSDNEIPRMLVDSAIRLKHKLGVDFWAYYEHQTNSKRVRGE